jgi:hypothetical protein
LYHRTVKNGHSSINGYQGFVGCNGYGLDTYLLISNIAETKYVQEVIIQYPTFKPIPLNPKKAFAPNQLGAFLLCA